ncbi:MAG: hypothetical protein KAJ66_02155 [Candidatus Omnitrophica bacterium]|nr:hypothetical protein [Candidatus Omnitrophota bacterium]
MEQLKITVGDITISVRLHDSGFRFEPNDVYRPFSSDNDPDVLLRVCRGRFSKRRLKEKLFDAGTTWSMFGENGRYVLDNSYQSIALESDFKSGTIYNKAVIGEQAAPFPLTYPLDEILVVNLLGRGRGMMVHSCGISDKGRGLLFAGSSQSGKSTMANLWKKEKDTAALSDDRIIVRKMKKKFWIYGTPWHGDAKVCLKEKAPLEKIFFLKHTKNNIIKKVGPADAVSRLIICSFLPFWDKKGMEFTLKFCAELVENVPCYELGFVPDEHVLDFVRG